MGEKSRIRNRKRGISLLAVMALLAGMIPFYGNAQVGEGSTATLPHLAFTEQTAGGQSSKNISGHDYINRNRWPDTIKSYLEENTDGTFTRVEATTAGVCIEEYSQEFEYLSSITLEMPLPIFGGYFSGEKYRFLLFGQTNNEENDEAEVLQIVKYDQSWNKLAVCSIKKANTTVPFDAGSPRMTEKDGKLYLYTSHEMYTTSDGLNHQANMTFVLDEETMDVTQSYSGIMNINYGYVSHSFNQYIATDGNSLYRLDHGDANPRAVVLTKASVDKITSCISKNVLIISGTKGANDTGVALGGFELAGNQLVAVGNSVDQTAETYDAFAHRNIFVASTDTELSATQTTWLTEYKNADIVVGNPHLVKVSEDELYVLWEEHESSSSTSLYTVKIAKINGNGKQQGDITTIYARLSDCPPIYTKNGELVWYVTNNSAPAFYHLSTENLSEYEFAGKIDLNDCKITLTPLEFEYDGFKKYEPEVSVTYGSYELQKGTDYQIVFSNNSSVGIAKATFTGRGIFEGSVEKEFQIMRKATPTPVPTATPTVQPSKTPAISQEPFATEEPDTTQNPDTTENPDVTQNPDTSENPDVTQNPDTSKNPNVTQNPDTTKKPAATATPENTVYPYPTDIPAETQSPSDSEQSGDDADDLTSGKIAKVSGLKVKNNKSKRLTITWKKVKGATGYQVQVAQNRTFTKKKKVTTSHSTKAIVKGLKKKKIYFVRVQAYCNTASGKNSGKWSAVKKIKIRK